MISISIDLASFSIPPLLVARTLLLLLLGFGDFVSDAAPIVCERVVDDDAFTLLLRLRGVSFVRSSISWAARELLLLLGFGDFVSDAAPIVCECGITDSSFA